MPTKKELLRNLSSYSPQEIADAIRAGVVSIYELGHEAGGAFTPLLRVKVKQLLAEQPQKEEPEAQEPELPKEETKDVVVFENPEIQQKVAQANEIQFVAPKNEDVTPLYVPPTLPQNENGMPVPRPMFSAIFSFKGRIRRTEYGLSYIIYFVLIVFWQVVADALLSDYTYRGSIPVMLIMLCILFILLWAIFAQGAKRCHDRGNSGFFQLIPFYFLWMLFAPGENTANEYGPCPK